VGQADGVQTRLVWTGWISWVVSGVAQSLGSDDTETDNYEEKNQLLHSVSLSLRRREINRQI
jgi:hypothetical protein